MDTLFQAWSFSADQPVLTPLAHPALVGPRPRATRPPQPPALEEVAQHCQHPRPCNRCFQMQWFPPSSWGCSCSPDSSQQSHHPAEQVPVPLADLPPPAPPLLCCTPALLCTCWEGGPVLGVKAEDLSCSLLTPTAMLSEPLRLHGSSCWAKTRICRAGEGNPVCRLGTVICLRALTLPACAWDRCCLATRSC